MKVLSFLLYYLSLVVILNLYSCNIFGNRIKTLNNKEVIFIVENEFTIQSLAKKLKKKELIEKEEDFFKTAKENGLNDKLLAYGKYRIKPHTKLVDLVYGFTKDKNGNGNREEKVNVSIYKFRDINQMASMVQSCLAIDSMELINYLEKKSTLKALGLKDKRELSAIFFPINYKMYFDTDVKGFVQKMKQEYDAFWNKERIEKIKKIGLKSTAEAVTLASIVYAEQGRNKEEWPVISALYLNRLKKGMKLQSDPTFKFCWGDALNGTQRLLEKHREVDCEYNTYKISGLPPGPICFTPKNVVDAVISPANVSYLFMCATPDYTGKHNFAVDDDEHMKNAKKYQTWIAEQENKKKK
jgi:UPF0755 protein